MTLIGDYRLDKRKKYSKEFKLDAISLVLDQNYTRSEAAKSLGLNPNVIGRWVKEHQADDTGKPFAVMARLLPSRKKLESLKRR